MRADGELDEFDDPQWIVFGGTPSPEPGMAQDHSAFDPLRRLFARSAVDVRADFSKVRKQIDELVSAMRSEVAGFELAEVQIELGFSASGRLVFVAEAGVNATVSITYQRKAEAPGDTTGSPVE